MPLEVLTPDPVPDEAPADSGLRHNILSPLETLSQSISAIAPTTTPALTVPLVFALAGNGTWLADLLACNQTAFKRLFDGLTNQMTVNSPGFNQVDDRS